MKLFFGNIEDNVVLLHEDEQQHISKVLRMREGEELFVTDGKGTLAKAQLHYAGKKIKLHISEIWEHTKNFPRQLHIAMAPTKNIDRTEFFVEKATELGIAEITFLLTENSERKNLNLERIHKQVLAASKQSCRTHFPKINELIKLSDFLKNVEYSQTFAAHCHENLERTSLANLAEFQNITLLIGPEGDFSEKEIAQLAAHGIKGLSLGTQRLRTETAALFAAAWNYEKMI